LEGLLASDPEVAEAFADAARLHASLQDYFKRQYKIDQVAALLDAPETATTPPQTDGSGVNPGQPGAPIVSPLPADSAYVPIYARLEKARRSRNAPRPASAARRWASLTAVVLLMSMGVVIWSLRSPAAQQPRLISGRITVAGRAVNEIPADRTFEVAGEETAVIELPGGARIELAAAASVMFRRDGSRTVVELVSGRGEFDVPAEHPEVVVKTAVGVVTTTGGKFLVDLVTELPAQVKLTEPPPLPQLTVAVALGSVTVEHSGGKTNVSAGEVQVFL
jgi:ferric-dicitrate binding protein FerR (iron transport regulator)